jgi:hypothetical protein
MRESECYDGFVHGVRGSDIVSGHEGAKFEVCSRSVANGYARIWYGWWNCPGWVRNGAAGFSDSVDEINDGCVGELGYGGKGVISLFLNDGSGGVLREAKADEAIANSCELHSHDEV